MTKVRVYELAKEQGIETGVVEQVCRDLKIEMPDQHLTYLSPEEARRVTEALAQGGGRAGVKETKVSGNVVRRRRRRRVDDAPAADAGAVAGGQGTVATSPTTVRRKRQVAEEAEVAAPAVETKVAVEEAAPATPTVTAKEEPAVAAAEPAPERAEPTAPEPAVEAAAEAPEKAAEASVAEVVAEPAAAEVAEKETSDAPAAKSEDVEEAKADAPADASAEKTEEPEDEANKRTSLVKVVRRVDDAIMANILAEAERRQARQAAQRAGGGRSRPGNYRGRDITPAPAATRDQPRGAQAPRGRVAWERQRDRSFNDRRRRRGRDSGGYQDDTPPAPRPHRTIQIQDTVTVGELASHLSVKASEIIKKLLLLGELVTVNNVLDMETVQLLAEEPEFNFSVENVAFDIEDYIPKVDISTLKSLPRDPVVTVMGHVDHGKTSLLDAIRRTRVTAGEAGGITQHIGAYRVPVKVNNQKRHIVFLDTPGHAAFSEMRSRGAQVTDVVILVIAADDGVMPQTIEAINHAKAAGVPLVVALNKIDKPEATPDKVKQQLTEYGVVDEAWGGDTQFIEVSAKQGTGIDTLLESVALQADVLELQAVVDRPAKGVVIEAELSKGRGPVATVLIQEGTIKRGDIVVAHKSMGRVRAMIDDRGKTQRKATPSHAVEILGLDSVPPPSALFFVVKDERDARAIVSHVEDKERKGRLAEERKKVSLDDLFEQMKAGDVKTLNLVLKSDVQGSLEALRTAFLKLKHPELRVEIIHAAVGAISERDVYLASASDAIIIGFNVRPEKNAKSLAEQDQVEIKLYSVIYAALEDVKLAMEGLLDPDIEENVVGRADVRDTFSIPRVGTIAGCAVLQGKVIRHGKARLIRDGIVIADTEIETLQRFKEQVTEVDRGHECGIKLKNYNDIKVGDEIECYELIEIAQKLELEEEI